MKWNKRLCHSKAGRMIFLLIALESSGHAQPYDLSWFTVSGSGADQTASRFSLGGSVGQPDASAGSGSRFSLDSGFWAVVRGLASPEGPALNWRFLSFTGTANGTRLSLFLDLPGEVYVDNLMVVTGAVAETGLNLVVNGDFETPLVSPWSAIGNYSSSAPATEPVFAGNSSLHLIATTGGSSGGGLIQDLPGLDPDGTYTLSLWYLPGANATTLTAELSSTFEPHIDIRPTPAILTQPRGLNVLPDGTVTFRVTAEGSAPLNYQWRRNGAIIPGATNSIFAITNVQATDGGSYTVVVHNDLGAVISEEAILVVLAPLRPPGDDFVERVSLVDPVVRGSNVGATIEPPEEVEHAGRPAAKSVWYTWTAPKTGVATFHTLGSTFDTVLAIYTGTSLSDLVETAADEDRGDSYTSRAVFNVLSNTTYHIAIDGFAGREGDFVLSWELEETIEIIPEIIEHPRHFTVLLNSNVTFSVQAHGTGLSYQWYRHQTPIVGATTSTLTISNVQPADVGLYRVRVTNSVMRGIESLPGILQIGQSPLVRAVNKFEELTLGVAGEGDGGGGLRSPRNMALELGGTGGGQSVVFGSPGEQIWSNVEGSSQAWEPTCCEILTKRPYQLNIINDAPADGIFTITTLGSMSEANEPLDTKMGVIRAIALHPVVACNENANREEVHSLVRFYAVRGAGYTVVVDTVTPGTIHASWILEAVPSRLQLVGSELNLQVDAAYGVGGQGPTYRWRKDGVEISDKKEEALHLDRVRFEDAGVYRVEVDDTLGETVHGIELLSVVELTPIRADGMVQVQMSGMAFPGMMVEAITSLGGSSGWQNVYEVRGSPMANSAIWFEFIDNPLPMQFYRVKSPGPVSQ